MDAAVQKPSTFRLKNIPSRSGRDDVMAAIDEVGFEGAYDFFYMPVRHHEARSQTFGYAFVNFVDPETGKQFCEVLQDGLLKIRQKVATVEIATIQGLASLKEHFQDKAIMARPDQAPVFKDSSVTGDVPVTLYPMTVAQDFAPNKRLVKVESLGLAGKGGRTPAHVHVRSGCSLPCDTWEDLPLPMRVEISSFLSSWLHAQVPLRSLSHGLSRDHFWEAQRGVIPRTSSLMQLDYAPMPRLSRRATDRLIQC
eukprot:TRINITY_DN91870_c0_g1_i1.p1 TRINITY_DN91870_c0_g1~~TRINITY_DN91870_c0_g1_i1.p1  ORF type:complete len:253 (+),score=37.57 TRINITY_DN91870_c0_g1_i1:130-888(+)